MVKGRKDAPKTLTPVRAGEGVRGLGQPLQPSDLPDVPVKVGLQHQQSLSERKRASHRVPEDGIPEASGVYGVHECPEPGVIQLPCGRELSQRPASHRVHSPRGDLHRNVESKHPHDSDVKHPVLRAPREGFTVRQSSEVTDHAFLRYDQMLDDLRYGPLARQGMRLKNPQGQGRQADQKSLPLPFNST
jgi:hypothetical protein